MGDIMSLYLTFETENEASNALSIVNIIVFSLLENQGYTVQNGELIGKNAKTGQDNLNACRTTSWDVIREINDRYGFLSPVNNSRYTDWRDYLPDGITIPEDVEIEDET